jgi:hypothetical protein
MKNKNITLLLTITLFLCANTFAQNYIYKGDNKYESTKSWEFKLNGSYWTSNPEITIAKHSNGGYLMISIDVPFSENKIGGTLFVFLIDGSVIKCTDKGIRDHVDNKSIALYNFTKTEMERLTQNRITKIRFSIISQMNDSETFTADNTKDDFVYGSINEKKYYETDLEVSNLFE